MPRASRPLRGKLEVPLSVWTNPWRGHRHTAVPSPVQQQLGPNGLN